MPSKASLKAVGMIILWQMNYWHSWLMPNGMTVITAVLHGNLVQRLADCSFIQRNENLLITGSTGIGKSYIATALGYQACIMGYKVLYASTPKLFARLKMAKADGTYIKEIAKIERQQLLILDDFAPVELP